MPVQSHRCRPVVTRPEVYFGELTNNDVYVRTKAEGIQLPARRDQHRHDVRGHRRHPDRRLPPAPRHRARPRRPDQAAVQRRRDERQPAADAAQHHATGCDARAVPHLRPRSVRRRHRRGAAGVDDGRLHDVGHVSVRASLSTGERAHQLHAQQRQGDDRRLRRHGARSTSSTIRIPSWPATARSSRACSRTWRRCRQTCELTSGIRS